MFYKIYVLKDDVFLQLVCKILSIDASYCRTSAIIDLGYLSGQ